MVQQNETPDGDSARLELGDPRLQDASRLTDEELWGEAFELLQGLEEEYPEDPMLMAMLGTVAGEMEARGLAYEYFRRGVAAQPSDPGTLVLLGAGLARFDDPDAESVLRLAAITAPDLPAARFQYGSYLAREGLYDQAVRELTAARDLDPEDAAVLRELGVAQWLGGHLDAAATSFDQAADLAADDPEMRLLAAYAHILSGEFSEGAEEVVRTSPELDHDGELQIVAALAAAAEGWADEAWTALARAEGAAMPADPEVVKEAEEVLEADEDASRRLLLDEVLPRLFHERILLRP